MAANKKAKKSAPKKKPKVSIKETHSQRKIKQGKHKSFRLERRMKVVRTSQVPSAFRLLRNTAGLLKRNWKLFIGITLVYGLLTVVLVRGFGSGTNLSVLKSTLQNSHANGLATSATLFSYLLGTSGSSSSAAGGTYQTILLIITSLVTIWALRQVLAGKKIRIRDAFYKGTYPLVQFTLVLIVVGLQLIPLLIGSWLYATVVGNGIAASPLEKIVWAILFLLLATLSLYMICSSLFALYIVTLPDMTPMKALRSARELVRFRRWTIMRKIIFLPLALLFVAVIIMIPVILIATVLAQWIFFMLSMLVLVVVNTYMYLLYRALL